ncbi:MAG: hypothetical protein ACYC6Y_24570 [Thermoguttaceae bacterium]
MFADCFGRQEARALLRVYLKGQLSNLHRKTAEAIALQFDAAPRTLQPFLESITGKFIKRRKVSGNPDLAVFHKGKIIVPCGHQVVLLQM